MSWEIERRFLVRGTPWDGHEGMELVQGYLARTDGVAVRVRLAADHAWLTIKGPSNGASRREFEYTLPLQDARDMLPLCGTRVVRKVRYRILVGAHIWDVDQFHGLNEGLALAEVELTSEDEAFEMPPWAGLEVTGDHRFANVQLADHPWSTWPSD